MHLVLGVLLVLHGGIEHLLGIFPAHLVRVWLLLLLVLFFVLLVLLLLLLLVLLVLLVLSVLVLLLVLLILSALVLLEQIQAQRIVITGVVLGRVVSESLTVTGNSLVVFL